MNTDAADLKDKAWSKLNDADKMLESVHNTDDIYIYKNTLLAAKLIASAESIVHELKDSIKHISPDASYANKLDDVLSDTKVATQCLIELAGTSDILPRMQEASGYITGAKATLKSISFPE